MRMMLWLAWMALGLHGAWAFEMDALPQKTGQVFLVDDYDYKVTEADKGLNWFAGNGGAVGTSAALSIGSDSFGTSGGCMRLAFDFTGQGEAFGGVFMSLLGLTDTKVELTGSGVERKRPPDDLLDRRAANHFAGV